MNEISEFPRISTLELHCRRFPAMVQWYRQVFAAEVSFRDAIQCWLRAPGGWSLVLLDTQFPERPRESAGLEGLALEFADFDTLARTYQRLRERLIRPERGLKNGRVTSLIYRDPDGNRVALRLIVDRAAGPQAVTSSLGEDFDFAMVFDDYLLTR